MKVLRIKAKTILNKTKVGENLDYTINPYVGCQFGCKYCYASYLSNLVKEDNKNWGNFVYVKENAVEVLKKELVRILKKNNQPNIMMSSATDPYQYVEAKEKLTRNILKILIEFNFSGGLLCLTKSPIILRDIDLFKEFKNLTLSLSICNNNEKIKNFFEPTAPSLKSRFKTLEILNKNNFRTCVFIAPILPYFENHLEELEELFKKIKDSGTNNIVYDLLNLYGNMTRYMDCFKNSDKGKKLYVDKASNNLYRNKMLFKINDLVKKYNFNTNIS